MHPRRMEMTDAQVLFVLSMKDGISIIHGSILRVTIPPGQPRGQVQPFRPGGGELFEAALSREEGGGAGGPRGEDCLFPGKISRICSRLVKEE